MHDDTAEEFALWKEEVIITVIIVFGIHTPMMLQYTATCEYWPILASRASSQLREIHNTHILIICRFNNELHAVCCKPAVLCITDDQLTLLNQT